MSRWNTWEYDELVSILSDYHKDVFGYRMRMAGRPREEIIDELDAIDQYMESMKSTLKGRNKLREDGWLIQEPNC